MQIVDIVERTVSLRSDIRNSWISFREMDCSLVAVVSDVFRRGRRLVGYGFNSNGRYAQSHLIRGRLRSRILEAEPGSLLTEDGTNLDAAKVWEIMLQDEKPGGHGDRAVAVGAVDMALHDLIGKIADVPVYEVLARRIGRAAASQDVFVYAAGGYYGGSNTSLVDELRSYLDLGYTHVKMKIGGAPLVDDLRRIESALTVVQPSRLAVDANGRLDRASALEYARALAPMGLMWYEEPCDPIDFSTLADVAGEYRGHLATGENLFSRHEVRALLEFGGLRSESDVIQVDPALAYGLIEYERVLDELRTFGWRPTSCIPHGGHQLSLHAAVAYGLGGNESYPGLFAPFGGFDDDAQVRDGFVHVPDGPGIGIERKAELFALCQAVAS